MSIQVTFELSSLVGMLATLMSTLILLPSVYEQYTKKCKGKVSVRMLVQVVLVNFLWVFYGYLEGDAYVAGRAVVGLIISATSVYLYYHYRVKSRKA